MDDKVVTIHGVEPLKSRWATASPTKPADPEISAKSSTAPAAKSLADLRSPKHNNEEIKSPRKPPRRGGHGKHKQSHSAQPNSQSRQQQRELPDLFPRSSTSKPSFPASPLQDRVRLTKGTEASKKKPQEAFALLDLSKPFNWADDDDDDI